MGTVAGEIGHGIMVKERRAGFGTMAFAALLAQAQLVWIVLPMTIDAARLACFVFAPRMTSLALDARVFSLERKVRDLGVINGGFLEFHVHRVAALTVFAQLTAVAVVMAVDAGGFAGAIVAAAVACAAFLPRMKAAQLKPGIAVVIKVELFRAALGMTLAARLVFELPLVGVFVPMAITAAGRQFFELGRSLAAVALAAPHQAMLASQFEFGFLVVVKSQGLRRNGSA